MADSVPSVDKGRGAWQPTGKDNGSRYYEYIAGKPLDGSSPTKDVNYQAVHLAVLAIQRRLINAGQRIHADGVLGRQTSLAIKNVQNMMDLTPDGKLGANTWKGLWHNKIYIISRDYVVPPRHLWGLMLAESVADPGAVGHTTPSDRGLFQINIAVHTAITPQEAFNPVFATRYTADRLASARVKYSGKGADLQEKCSIAQHNSPVQAQKWFTTGVPPSEQIRLYVEKILGLGDSF